MAFSLRIIACALLLVSVIQSIPATEAFHIHFPDIVGSWYRYQYAIEYLTDRGVIDGNPDGTYKPKNAINRAEFLKIVFQARSEKEPIVGSSCFADIDEHAWFAPYVCAAKRRDIVGGYPDGTFKPEQTVNIAEALKIILRTYGREVNEPSGEKWYEAYTKEFDRTDTFPRNSYIPWEPLTRERAADLLVRVLRHEEDRITLRESPGCGKPLRSSSETINVNGIERSFLLTVPDDYLSSKPFPLIIAFHGRTNSNEQVRSYYGLDRNADDYMIAYPAAISNGNGSFNWTMPNSKTGDMGDIAYFDALVEHIAKNYCIDMDRIFTVGHSLGAWMANSVACIRGGIVRGSATVGGDSLITDCPGPAASMIAFNPDDKLSSFAGAEKARDMRKKENACSDEKRSTEPKALNCEKYLSCDGGNTVVWCPHELDIDPQGNNYPHNWPREMAPAIVDFFDSLD